MRYTVLILTVAVLTGCASTSQVQVFQWENADSPNRAAVESSQASKNGQRILIGFGIGAALGALAGAAIVQSSNDLSNDIIGDDSNTPPWKGALVGSVVGAGIGALVAAITAKKKTRRSPPRTPPRYGAGRRDANPNISKLGNP